MPKICHAMPADTPATMSRLSFRCAGVAAAATSLRRAAPMLSCRMLLSRLMPLSHMPSLHAYRVIVAAAPLMPYAMLRCFTSFTPLMLPPSFCGATLDIFRYDMLRVYAMLMLLPVAAIRHADCCRFCLPCAVERDTPAAYGAAAADCRCLILR